MAVKRKTVFIIVCIVAVCAILLAGLILYFASLHGAQTSASEDVAAAQQAQTAAEEEAQVARQAEAPAQAQIQANQQQAEAAAQAEAARDAQAAAQAQASAAAEANAKAHEAQAPMFPWPPPEASASYVLPAAVFAKANTLGDVADEILAALTSQGYVEHSYFATPHGVALVTRLERINANGTRAAPRWPSGFNPPGLIDFLRGLFFVEPGNYRVIVFIIENDAFQQSSAQVSEDDAKAWLRTGLNVLPQQLAQEKYLGNCTALIYEFMSTGDRVKLVDSELSGLDHLKVAGLQSLLGTTH